MTVRVTIIVTQRERFGMTRESLESLYCETDTPFALVYVDGNAPRETAAYLAAEAARRRFRLIRRDDFLTPNEARNLGLAEAATDYVVFVDNDVLFRRGWLGALLACADDTGADVVAPLICQGLPVESRVHHAGGDYTREADLDAFLARDPGEAGRDFIEDMNHHRQPLAEVQDALVRRETGFCEFHCVLVRRAVFDRIGPLDEAIMNSKEHIDFSMCVRAAGGRVVFEPASVVTYVFPCAQRPLQRSDWPFFALRWSDAWGHRSLMRFHDKWRLRRTGSYVGEKKRIYAMRRVDGILIPLFATLPVIGRSRFLGKAFGHAASPLERVVNRLVVARWTRARRAARGTVGPAADEL